MKPAPGLGYSSPYFFFEFSRFACIVSRWITPTAQPKPPFSILGRPRPMITPDNCPRFHIASVPLCPPMNTIDYRARWRVRANCQNKRERISKRTLINISARADEPDRTHDRSAIYFGWFLSRARCRRSCSTVLTRWSWYRTSSVPSDLVNLRKNIWWLAVASRAGLPVTVTRSFGLREFAVHPTTHCAPVRRPKMFSDGAGHW